MGLTSAEIGELIDQQWQPLLVWIGACHGVEEDIVQEAFVKLASLKVVPDNPTAWLYRVTRNLAHTARTAHHRRLRRQRLGARPDSIEPQMANSDEIDEVRQALQGLPDDLRQVVVARIWGGLSFEQIGLLVGNSAATVWRRYQESLDILRTQLGESCPHSIN